MPIENNNRIFNLREYILFGKHSKSRSKKGSEVEICRRKIVYLESLEFGICHKPNGNLSRDKPLSRY